jgi:hypothetical protein
MIEKPGECLALFRLLDRQGLLTGDTNILRRFAMQEVIKDDMKRENQREIMRMKSQAALMYPKAARQIFSEEEDPVPSDLPDYDPDNPGFSEDNIEFMLEALTQSGFFMEEMNENG